MCACKVAMCKETTMTLLVVWREIHASKKVHSTHAVLTAVIALNKSTKIVLASEKKMMTY